MDRYNFHTSIAFIPYNYKRNSNSITRMFRERPDRLSICFHGNDHTGAEFATRDSRILNSMLTVAEERMNSHEKRTGIPCDKVIVFPQGNFSVEAMNVLKAHNFHAAVNTGPYPQEEHTNLTMAETLEPAILRYAGFPLFLRKYVRGITLPDIAFNLLLGKPALIVEHHEIFKEPDFLTDLVSRINTLEPSIRWSSLGASLENSFLVRQTSDRKLQVRAYSNRGTIHNSSDSFLDCSVEWVHREQPPASILVDGASADVGTNGAGLESSLSLPPHSSRKFSLFYENDFGLSALNQTFSWTVKAFLRRRVSELRDNYLSKSPRLMLAAKTFLRAVREK